VSQADALHEALDALSSNDFVIGDHHFSLQVLADIESSADSSGAAQKLHRLGDSIASARSLLADTGMLVAREDLALEAAFWAQLPGNFAMRPRRAPITSRNFSGMAPFHNYPTGRAKQKRRFSILFLTACERSRRGAPGRSQGHGPYAHMWSDGIGKDRVHRLSDHFVESSDHDPGHLRQGSWARDSRPGARRRILRASDRRVDGVQPTTTGGDTGQY